VKGRKQTRNAAAAKPPLPPKMKERLYPAVLELFSRNDFHQVNLRGIYRKSGLSPSTIYKYFQSKEDLLFTILDEKISEIGGLVQAHVKGLESSREMFRKVFWATLDYYDQNPGVAVAAFVTVPMRTWMREKTYVRKDAEKFFREICQYGLRRKEIDASVTPRDCMDLYFMFCYRQIHLWYYKGMKWKLADTVPRFFPLFWKTVSSGRE